MRIEMQKLAAATAVGAALAMAGCARAEVRPAPDAGPAMELAPPAAEGPAAPGDWTILRVGGATDAEVTVVDGVTKTGEPAPFYAAGDASISAALPVGYPAPTPPGAIELKRYDTVRQAVRGSGRAEGEAFFPLFRHIVSRDIAMTAPVVMTGEMAGAEDEPDTMAFLYRSTEIGATGEAERGVTVEDTAPTVVLTIGFQGVRTGARLDDLRLTLDGWLFEQTGGGRWVASGPARLLGYNGPDTPRSRQWWELQVPVRWEQAD